MFNNVQHIFLRYFYLGNSKYAPGTVTSFCIALGWFFIPNIFFLQLLIFLFHVILGFYFCYKFILTSNDKDPSYIVIDEVVGMMLALFLVPKTIEAYTLSFLLFRLLDIFKPSIIDRSQNFNFGIGIMLDDLVAGFLVLLIINGLYVL